jgi:PAS domain S-box-containing protein
MMQSDIKKWAGFDLFNQAPINIAVIDRTYRVVDANIRFREAFGRWEGKKCYQVYKHLKTACRRCQAAKTFADGQIRFSLEKVRDQKGNLRYLRVRIVPYRDESGNITHIMEMSTDVTDRERTLEQYQTIFDNVPCYVTVIDKGFKIVTANKYFWDTFGKDTGRYCFESYKKGKGICEKCPASQVFKDGKVHHSLQEGYDKKGGKVVYMVTASPYSKEGGKVHYVVEMAVNITKAFILEKKLKETREFQEVIIQNATDGIIASSEAGLINLYNPSAKKILQYPANKILKKKQEEEIFPKEFLTALDAGLGPVVLKESKLKDYKGNDIPVVFSGTKLKKNSRVIGTVMFFQDLSKIKQLESEILEAERLAAVGQTVAGLSHGIKNILMGLEGGIYVVNSGIRRNDNTLVKQGWTMLQSNIEKVSAFVKEFLSFARGTVPEVEWVDPVAIANEVIELYKDKITQAGVVFIPKIQKNIPRAPMDHQAIHTCICNLISNAIDACQMSDTKPSTIIFILFEKNDSICYEIKDNGCGMDYEVKKKIFTSFFTTKGSGQGTGLGLLTTRKIVQEHGGKILFQSSPGKGSVFRLEFPRGRLPIPKAQDES